MVQQFSSDLSSEMLRMLPLDAVSLYTRDLQAYPDLPMWRKLELEQLALQGDEQAKHELIESALRYTAHVAALYVSAYGDFLRHDSYLDLVQIGNLALVENFERALKAISISGYLRGIVKNVIRQYCLYRSGMIRIPKHKEWIAKAPRVESLDATIGDTELTYHDILAALPENEDGQHDDSRSYQGLCELLHQAMETLTEKQREVVVRHYGFDGQEPETLYAISKRLGLGTTAAFDRLRLALKKIRRMCEEAEEPSR